ncbi:MAG: hypothetical protein VB138_11295 [Burkholderia sp.]
MARFARDAALRHDALEHRQDALARVGAQALHVSFDELQLLLAAETALGDGAGMEATSAADARRRISACVSVGRLSNAYSKPPPRPSRLRVTHFPDFAARKIPLLDRGMFGRINSASSAAE